MIKAIVFDIGGVIVGDLSPSLIPYLSKKHKKEFGFLKVRWRKYERQYREGKFDENTFWNGFIQETEINEKADDLKKFTRKLFDKQIDGTLDVAKQLKGKYKLAILSNHTKEWVDYIIKKHKLDGLFNPIVVSSDVGSSKPELKIYNVLLKQLNLTPDECLFIDNAEPNEISAENLGFKILLFRDSEQLKHDLKKLGVEAD